MGEHDKLGACEVHLRSQCRLGMHPWKLQVLDPGFSLRSFWAVLADLPNKSDKKQNALNTELSEFSTELKVTSSSVYKADSEPVRDHLYYTFHSDDCPIFLKKKKKISWTGTPYSIS